MVSPVSTREAGPHDKAQSISSPPVRNHAESLNMDTAAQFPAGRASNGAEAVKASPFRAHPGATTQMPRHDRGASCRREFGANAAWLRLNVILYNLLSADKRVGLPEEFHTARPKRLRFLLLNTVAKVVRHARETLLHCTKEIARALADASRTIFSLNRSDLVGV
jgi:hypothetical protein